MARMRRGLVHSLAWSLATGAAVTLSWWGVHTVMAGTAYDRPLARPLAPAETAAGSPTGPEAEPRASSTQRPRTAPALPSRSPSATRGESGPTREPTPSRSSAAPSPTAGTGGGTVKSYAVDGGRVAFDLGDTSAELVSATPASGWQMQVWKQDTWIRVTFTRDGREISVFCVWHDTAPRVEIDDRRT
ncbi:hypothetical protein ACFPM3_33535 [Streptomyces coeruleoprunus]|uniref:Secreted protein n=1 Tax=Streptomyces coeruleoprunus TaxID=285563 RepID=A0ABV9XSA4_9ACTN